MDDLAFMWNGEPVQHKLALLRSHTATDVLRLDRERARWPDDDVIHVAVTLVDIIEDYIPERLELPQGPSDLRLAAHARQPRRDVEHATPIAEPGRADDEAQADRREGQPYDTEESEGDTDPEEAPDDER